MDLSVCVYVREREKQVQAFKRERERGRTVKKRGGREGFDEWRGSNFEKICERFGFGSNRVFFFSPLAPVSWFPFFLSLFFFRFFEC